MGPRTKRRRRPLYIPGLCLLALSLHPVPPAFAADAAERAAGATAASKDRAKESRRPQPRAGRRPPSWKRLLKRVSRYLNSQPVRQASVTAVLAVRGGIPTSLGEDLDQRLLDRVRLFRTRLLVPEATGVEARSAGAIYGALSVSQYVQALESPSLSEDSRLQARKALRDWARETKVPRLPKNLKRLLTGPTSAYTAKALVAAGWGRYCRELAPDLSAENLGFFSVAPALADRPDTLELDEALESLRRSWTGKKLSAEDAAQAHFFAGQVYGELSRTELRGIEAPKGTALEKPVAPSVARTIPRRVAKSLPRPVSSRRPFDPKALYAGAAKSVVLIICGSSDGEGELGSGSLLDKDGRILTNAHVVVQDSTARPWDFIRVYLKPDKLTGDPKKDMAAPFKARVVSWNTPLDLALLELSEPPPGLSALALADPEQVSVGDRVAAIGHPEQGGLWTLTTGVVSSLVADIGGVKGKNVFQTDTSINRGNSGGPLINGGGQIVGVNTLMARRAADGLAITDVNFAVKSDVALRWLQKAGFKNKLAEPIDGPLWPVSAPLPPTRTAPAGTPGAVVESGRMISEGKPFSIDDLLEWEIQQMEQLESEMRQKVLKWKKLLETK